MDPNLPQHDETIVPLRPEFRSAEAQPMVAQPAAATRQGTALMVGGGAVLVAGIIAAFVWLPSRVEHERASPAPVATAEPEAAPAARPVLSAEEKAALKAQAEGLLAGLLTLQDKLTALSADQWAPEDWKRYQELSAAGDDAFLAEDFTAAVTGYTDATALGDAIVARAAASVERSFNAAEAALYAGNAEVAIEQYDLVLTIDPNHAQAITQRARAERLPEVLAIVQRADAERARGDLETALASYREALAIDDGWALARAGVDEILRTQRNAEFDRVLSNGFALLGSEDFVAAQNEFRAALSMRPDSREARDGLEQAEQGAKLDEIALAEARGLAFERRELWEQAIALYRSVLANDETMLFAQTGLVRAEERAGLDAKLRNLLDNPTLLFGDRVLADARKLLETAAAEDLEGERLAGQLEELDRLVDLAAQPIPVRLTSDELTTVTLYRVGQLGTFVSRDLELRPGTYTAIGSRDGYRDVRQTFTVRPGGNLAPISVVCVEPI